MKPQFKGKIFVLENYNIGMSRYLISGCDVWLNNPRRPMEASGTSGQKASVNGVINFSVLDGWWAEGYDQTNGWTIGTNAEFTSYEEQDLADSESLYNTLENKIVPLYYENRKDNIPDNWIEIMKNSIITTGGEIQYAKNGNRLYKQNVYTIMQFIQQHITQIWKMLQNIVNGNLK